MAPCVQQRPGPQLVVGECMETQRYDLEFSMRPELMAHDLALMVSVVVSNDLEEVDILYHQQIYLLDYRLQLQEAAIEALVLGEKSQYQSGAESPFQHFAAEE